MSPRTMTILWPSFLMAAALEGAVFSVVDPTELRWLDQIPLEASPLAIYSLSFLAFWGAISTSGALTALLCIDPDAVDLEPPAD